MWKAAKGAFGSKRFFAALVAGIGYVVMKQGWDFDVETAALAVSPLWFYIWGQSVSDIGKGKRELDYKTFGPVPETVVSQKVAPPGVS